LAAPAIGWPRGSGGWRGVGKRRWRRTCVVAHPRRKTTAAAESQRWAELGRPALVRRCSSELPVTRTIGGALARHVDARGGVGLLR
jgi:hypothetical protein